MEHLGLSSFVAKISSANAASLALFSRLGFVLAKEVPLAEETHLVCGPAQGLRARVRAACGAAGYAERRCREEEEGGGGGGGGGGAEASALEASTGARL